MIKLYKMLTQYFIECTYLATIYKVCTIDKKKWIEENIEKWQREQKEREHKVRSEVGYIVHVTGFVCPYFWVFIF